MKSSECYPNGTCQLHETYSKTNSVNNDSCGCHAYQSSNYKAYVPTHIINSDMNECEKWCENNAAKCEIACKYCCWGIQKCDKC